MQTSDRFRMFRSLGLAVAALMLVGGVVLGSQAINGANRTSDANDPPAASADVNGDDVNDDASESEDASESPEASPGEDVEAGVDDEASESPEPSESEDESESADPSESPDEDGDDSDDD